MKKIMLIIIMFLSFINSIYAKEDLVIDDIKISNGEISPKFDKYNNYYSLSIDETVKTIEFQLDYNQNDFDVEITNNENIVNNKLIYVSIFDKNTEEQNTYIFKIYINEENEVINILDDYNELKIEDKNYDYAPLIGTICFVLIIFVYYIMFLR